MIHDSGDHGLKLRTSYPVCTIGDCGVVKVVTDQQGLDPGDASVTPVGSERSGHLSPATCFTGELRPVDFLRSIQRCS